MRAPHDAIVDIVTRMMTFIAVLIRIYLTPRRALDPFRSPSARVEAEKKAEAAIIKFSTKFNNVNLELGNWLSLDAR